MYQYRCKTIADLHKLGAIIADQLSLPLTIELIGDVGSGKTTLTQGIAQELGLSEPITSPSFTISKTYQLTHPRLGQINLVHYDFYRLPDPGIMQDDLLENTADPHTLTVIEWADSVSALLPPQRLTLHLSVQPDGSRQIISSKPLPVPDLEDQSSQEGR